MAGATIPQKDNSMARSTFDITTKKTAQEIEAVVASFMEKEGFKKMVVRSEPIWKKGIGMLAAPQFMKTEAKDGQLHLEAWIKQAILPGWYVGEMAITGFYGFAIKAAIRKRVEKLTALVTG
jgi:hypothetical protein